MPSRKLKKYNSIRRKRKTLFNPRGSVIDKGAMYVVVILTLLIFGAYIFVGGTLPTKLPEATTDLVNLIQQTPEPSKTGLQLYTFYGATLTPHPTHIPHLTSPVSDLKLVDCGRHITGAQEPQMVWGYILEPYPAGSNDLALKVFYTNKHALLLGAGAITQMKKHPTDSVTNPSIGDPAIKDQDNFPFFPALFLTDITAQPADTSGDAQAGGQANKPDDIYGTWKAKDATDPPENGRDLRSDADSWPPSNIPASNRDYNFTSEIIWKSANVKAHDPTQNQYVSLQPGHRYRAQIVLHDGGTPSDIATACVQFTWPGGSASAPVIASCASKLPLGGQTYTSTYTISGQNGVVIDGATFNNTAGRGCLKIVNSSNITVRNSTFTNCAMNTGDDTGPDFEHSIDINSSNNITIEHNNFNHVMGGIYVWGARSATYNNIKINYNCMWDFPVHNAKNTFIQFDSVNGPGHEIKYNQLARLPRQPNPCTDPAFGKCKFSQDNVNLYQSGGTSSSYFQVVGNYIKFGPYFRADGGIVTGDSADGVEPGAYVLIRDNTVIDTSGTGIGIGGGTYHQIIDNYVFASPGRPESWIGVGFFKWRSNNSFPCANHTIKGNQVNWTDAYGVNNPYIGSCGLTNGSTVDNDNNWKANINRCSKAPGTIAWSLPVDFPECRP